MQVVDVHLDIIAFAGIRRGLLERAPLVEPHMSFQRVASVQSVPSYESPHLVQTFGRRRHPGSFDLGHLAWRLGAWSRAPALTISFRV